LSLWDEYLVIIWWFYVDKNCIFVHTTDNVFPVTGPLWRPLPHWPQKWRFYRTSHASHDPAAIAELLIIWAVLLHCDLKC